jgi:hypothetical protein
MNVKKQDLSRNVLLIYRSLNGTKTASKIGESISKSINFIENSTCNEQRWKIMDVEKCEFGMILISVYYLKVKM